jgi:hypothetical protein
MQYQVPQFIDTEDKVVGPFSLRQFAYVGVAVLISAIAYFFPADVAICHHRARTGGRIARAFVRKINGRPLIKVATAAFNYYWKPQMYVWKAEHPVGNGMHGAPPPPCANCPRSESIAQGNSLHKSWENLQTGTPGNKRNPPASSLKKRWGSDIRYSSGKAATARRRGAWIIAKNLCENNTMAAPSTQDAGTPWILSTSKR